MLAKVPQESHMHLMASNGELIDTNTGKSWAVTDIVITGEDEPTFTLNCPKELALVPAHPAGGYRLIIRVDDNIFQVQPTEWTVNGASGEIRGLVLF